jgi:thiamine-phosphate pyrophosphorylase
MPDYSLYLVLDPDLTAGRPLTQVAREALEGGVTMMQLRYKGNKTREFLELAHQIRQICLSFRVPLIVNDRLDVALAVDAEGAHVGQEDLPAREARRILGRHRILGVSATCLREAEEAEEIGASYVGLGTIFSTSSKADACRPLGVEAIGEVSQALRIPVVAIGGINLQNAEEVIRKGAAGVAVISAILHARDSKEAARQLKAAIQRGMISASRSHSPDQEEVK